jgi:hypothetical protein
VTELIAGGRTSPLQEVSRKMDELHVHLSTLQTQAASRDEEVHRRTVALIDAAEAGRVLDVTVARQLGELQRGWQDIRLWHEKRFARLTHIVLGAGLAQAVLLLVVAILIVLGRR